MTKSTKKGKQKRIPTALPRKGFYTLRGGPLDGARILLATPGTLPIRVKGEYGYYNGANDWIDLT